MRKRITLAVVATIAALAWAQPASAGATRKITFTNNTGQQANDLHVEFKQAVDPQPPAGPWGPFPNENGSGTSKVDFSGGTVDNGDSVDITFKTGSSKITIKKWWWTRDGRQIGSVMGESAVAMVSYDQDDARVGETLTVSLLALADHDKDATFDVSYTITDPDGLVTQHPSLWVDVQAGTGLHQEIEVSTAKLLGTYTLSYEAVDLATSEVHHGTSMVEVNSGVFPRPLEHLEPAASVH